MQKRIEYPVLVSAWPLKIEVGTMVADDGLSVRIRPEKPPRYGRVFLAGTLSTDCGPESLWLDNVSISGAFSRTLDLLKGSSIELRLVPGQPEDFAHLRKGDRISLDCDVTGSTSVPDRNSEWQAFATINRVFWMSRPAAH